MRRCQAAIDVPTTIIKQGKTFINGRTLKEQGDKMFEITEDLIKKELKVIPSTGFYKNEGEFIKEAINTLLATRKDLRITIACELYKRGEISFGKACEIASLNIEEMKEVLHKRGIKRHVSVNVEEMEAMAKKAVERARR